MARLLILVLLVVGVSWWLFSRAARLRESSHDRKGRSDAGRSVQEMVTCAHCGLHLPRGEAHGVGEVLYCSEEHRRLGPKS